MNIEWVTAVCIYVHILLSCKINTLHMISSSLSVVGVLSRRIRVDGWFRIITALGNEVSSSCNSNINNNRNSSSKISYHNHFLYFYFVFLLCLLFRGRATIRRRNNDYPLAHTLAMAITHPHDSKWIKLRRSCQLPIAYGGHSQNRNVQSPGRKTGPESPSLHAHQLPQECCSCSSLMF